MMTRSLPTIEGSLQSLAIREYNDGAHIFGLFDD